MIPVVVDVIRNSCRPLAFEVRYTVTSSRLPIMLLEKMHHSMMSLIEKYDNIVAKVVNIFDDVSLGLRLLHETRAINLS